MKSQYIFISYLIVGLLIGGVALIKPYHNWDMIGYVGAVKSFEIHEKETLHNYVYEELKKFVSEDTYQELVSGRWREAMSRDPEAFKQQLPFYQIRLIYNSSIYFISKLGINIFFATYLLSAVSVLLGLCFLFFAFKSHIDNFLLFMFPILGLSMGLLDIARYSTPDGLTFLCVSVIGYMLIKHHWLLFIMLPLSILVKTDLIIFVSLILFYLLVFYKRWRVLSVGALFLSIGLYFWVNMFYGNYGWGTVFYVTFIHRFIYPANANFDINIINYFTVLIKGISSFLITFQFLFYVSIMTLSAFLYIKTYGLISIYRVRTSSNVILFLSLISLVYIFLHFLLFPLIDSRFFVGQYMLGALGFLFLLTENQTLNLRKNA